MLSFQFDRLYEFRPFPSILPSHRQFLGTRHLMYSKCSLATPTIQVCDTDEHKEMFVLFHWTPTPRYLAFLESVNIRFAHHSKNSWITCCRLPYVFRNTCRTIRKIHTGNTEACAHYYKQHLITHRHENHSGV